MSALVLDAATRSGEMIRANWDNYVMI
jgi:hypothetical protein